MAFDPYARDADDTLTQLCQVQIFFALLSSVALSFSDDADAAASKLEGVLCVMMVVPGVLALCLNNPVLSLPLASLPSIIGARPSLSSPRRF